MGTQGGNQEERNTTIGEAMEGGAVRSGARDVHALLGQSVILVDSLKNGEKELDEHVVLDVKIRKRLEDGKREEHALVASRVSCVSSWMPRDAVLTFETNNGCQRQVMVHTPLRKLLCTSDIEEVRNTH